MRLIKTLGLAAVAVIAAMAFLGASSASAEFNTVICTEKSAELKCPEAKQLTLKLIHTEALDPVLLGPPDILCEKALLSGETLHLGKPFQIHIHELTYSVCSTKIIIKINCTVTVEHVGLLDLLKTAANLGTLTDLEREGSFTKVHVVCGGFLNCTYEGKGLTGHALGAESATTKGSVTYTEQEVTKVAGGEGCPETGKLDAKFVDLEPGLFIRE